MKCHLFFLLISLFAIQTTAVGLSYAQSEYLYEPGKQIDFVFYVSNMRDNPSEVTLKIDTGKLNDYVSLPPLKSEIAAKQQKQFVVKIFMPNNLQNGLYSIIIKASEGKGMVRSAAEVTVNILKPYDNGYPSPKLRISATEDKLHYALSIRNIGRTPYQVSSKLALKEQNTVIAEIPIPQKTIPAFSTEHIVNDVPIPNLPPGEYLAEIDLGETKATQITRIGEIQTSVNGEITLTANKENEFSIPLTLKWNKPVKTLLALYIYKTGGRLLKKELETTLNPGFNNIPITIQVPQTPKGTYRAMLISGGDNPFRTEFKINIDSTINEEVVTGRAINTPGQRKTLFAIGTLVSIAAALILLAIALSRKNEKTPTI